MSKTWTKRIVFPGWWLVGVCSGMALVGCSAESPADPEHPDTETGSWVFHTPFSWTHDGTPYRGQSVIVYSDAASEATKRRLAQIADARLGQVLTLFDFHDLADLRYPPGSSSIDIYLNVNHPESVNWAYWGGFIITIRSSDISGHWWDYTVYIVRHELTHVFEFLIEGRGGLGTDVWFREGLAVHVGCIEHTGWRTIRSLSELESWIAQNREVPGGGNPIGIHQHSDFPQGADRHEYMRLSELAVTYLLDDAGMGRSYADALALFYDIRAGRPFPAAFEDRFGIGLDAFESEFFDRVTAYLAAMP